MPKTDRSVPTPANDHKSLTGMDIASGIAENPGPSKTVPKESRPLRWLVNVESGPGPRGRRSAGRRPGRPPGQRLEFRFAMIRENTPYLLRGRQEVVERRFELLQRENDLRNEGILRGMARLGPPARTVAR